MFGALMVGLFLACYLGATAVVLTSGRLDGYGDVVLGLLSLLPIVLGVGLVASVMTPRPGPAQDEPPNPRRKP